MSYSQNQLKAIAQSNPKELARIITSPNADTHMLTFGAELLGEADERIALPALRQLLKHVHALVREGAIMGISSLYMNKKPPQDIIERLRTIANNDPSPSLRGDAKALLDEFQEAP